MLRNSRRIFLIRKVREDMNLQNKEERKSLKCFEGKKEWRNDQTN